MHKLSEDEMKGNIRAYHRMLNEIAEFFEYLQDDEFGTLTLEKSRICIDVFDTLVDLIDDVDELSKGRMKEVDE